MTTPMIQIGATKDAVREARGAINDILRAPHLDNRTKIAALSTLATLCNVNGTSITNCNFTSGAK